MRQRLVATQTLNFRESRERIAGLLWSRYAGVRVDQHLRPLWLLPDLLPDLGRDAPGDLLAAWADLPDEAVTEGRLDVTNPGFVNQMYECLDCRACEAVCPSGVQYGKLVEPARAQIEKHIPRPRWQRLARKATFEGVFADLRRFRAFSSVFKVYQRSGAQWLVRRSRVLKPLGLDEMEEFLPADVGTVLCAAGAGLRRRSARNGRGWPSSPAVSWPRPSLVSIGPPRASWHATAAR